LCFASLLLAPRPCPRRNHPHRVAGWAFLGARSVLRLVGPTTRSRPNRSGNGAADDVRRWSALSGGPPVDPARVSPPRPDRGGPTLHRAACRALAGCLVPTPVDRPRECESGPDGVWLAVSRSTYSRARSEYGVVRIRSWGLPRRHTERSYEESSAGSRIKVLENAVIVVAAVQCCVE
jgi:hypothetical protein